MGETSAKRTITICTYCRKRIHKERNGAWYHDRNSSVSCRPGEGSDRRATPLRIEVSDGGSAPEGTEGDRDD